MSATHQVEQFCFLSCFVWWWFRILADSLPTVFSPEPTTCAGKLIDLPRGHCELNFVLFPAVNKKLMQRSGSDSDFWLFIWNRRNISFSPTTWPNVTSQFLVICSNFANGCCYQKERSFCTNCSSANLFIFLTHSEYKKNKMWVVLFEIHTLANFRDQLSGISTICVHM